MPLRATAPVILFVCGVLLIVLATWGLPVSAPIPPDAIQPARREAGPHAYSAALRSGLLEVPGDTIETPQRSALALFEDGVRLGPAHTEHVVLAARGEGRFSHWRTTLVFSSSDGTEARARTFGWRRKMFLVSTPTIAGLSRIEREYLATDQRRYFLPCPHCGAMQWLRFERLVWDEGAPETARYLCEACDRPIGEEHKARMLAAGEWRSTAEAEDPQAIGFHISALYSPPGWLSWAEIARLWLGAQGDDRAIKTFKNTVFGET
jgi:hypothetical protein